MTWLGESAALAVLSFDVDAESAILAQGRRYADHAMVMTHQAYGPLVGVPRLLRLLDDVAIKATFFVPGLTADRYPETVERIAAAGHEIGHHSYSHRSPVDLGEVGERTDFERALAALERVGVQPKGHRTSVFGVMTIPVLLLIMHGPIATNILNLYSCSLAALSVGLRASRWKVTAAAAVVGSGVLVAFIQSESFATSFDNWIASIVVWISPWAGITLVEYFVLRRGKVDVRALYEPPDRSPFGDVNWPAIVALVLGLAAGWSWQYGLVGPLQGPIAKALGNTDFSWAAGMLVAGGLYWALAGRRVRASTSQRFARS
jgi:Polysaccharide deacetylase/Permease for cytosine/purines, uracil, thiamine, allantoin